MLSFALEDISVLFIFIFTSDVFNAFSSFCSVLVFICFQEPPFLYWTCFLMRRRYSWSIFIKLFYSVCFYFYFYVTLLHTECTYWRAGRTRDLSVMAHIKVTWRQTVDNNKALFLLAFNDINYAWFNFRRPVYVHRISGRFDVGNLASYMECDKYFKDQLHNPTVYLM